MISYCILPLRWSFLRHPRTVGEWLVQALTSGIDEQQRGEIPKKMGVRLHVGLCVISIIVLFLFVSGFDDAALPLNSWNECHTFSQYVKLLYPRVKTPKCKKMTFRGERHRVSLMFQPVAHCFNFAWIPFPPLVTGTYSVFTLGGHGECC